MLESAGIHCGTRLLTRTPFVPFILVGGPSAGRAEMFNDSFTYFAGEELATGQFAWR
jgi:hypothetical protein